MIGTYAITYMVDAQKDGQTCVISHEGYICERNAFNDESTIQD